MYDDFRLAVTRGDDKTFVLKIKKENLPVNITSGYTFFLTAKERLTDSEPKITLTSAAGDITVFDGPNGIAHVRLLPAKTTSFSARLTELFTDVQVVKDGKPDTVCKGILVVEPDTTT